MRISIKKSKSLLLLCLLFGLAGNTYSQRLYVKGGVGYSIGTNKDIYKFQSNYNYDLGDTMTTTSKFHTEKYSFGQGPGFEFGIGSKIGDYISIELTGFYHSSTNYTFRYEDYNDFESYYTNFYTEIQKSGKSYGIKPGILFWLPAEGFKPYFRLGGVFAFGSLKEETEFRVFNTHPYYYPTENITNVFEYNTSFAMGYSAGAGFEIALASGIKFYGEIDYSQYSITPKKGQYTEYQYRGQGFLDQLTVSEREFEFVEEYEINGTESENEPSKQLFTSYSFSNVGLIAGIKVFIFD